MRLNLLNFNKVFFLCFALHLKHLLVHIPLNPPFVPLYCWNILILFSYISIIKTLYSKMNLSRYLWYTIKNEACYWKSNRRLCIFKASLTTVRYISMRMILWPLLHYINYVFKKDLFHVFEICTSCLVDIAHLILNKHTLRLIDTRLIKTAKSLKITKDQISFVSLNFLIFTML